VLLERKMRLPIFCSVMSKISSSMVFILLCSCYHSSLIGILLFEIGNLKDKKNKLREEYFLPNNRPFGRIHKTGKKVLIVTIQAYLSRFRRLPVKLLVDQNTKTCCKSCLQTATATNIYKRYFHYH